MSRNSNPQPTAARLHLLSAQHRLSPSRRHSIPQPGHHELSTANCELRTENREFKTVICERRTENSELKTANCELRTENCELRTTNYELPTNFAPRAIYSAKTSSQAFNRFFIFACISVFPASHLF